LIVAGLVSGPAKLALWVLAVAVNDLGTLLGSMRGWRISPEHFTERYGLFIIIALGESIVAIGVGAAGLPLDGGEILAALLGITVAACLWWSYFDWVVYVTLARLVEADDSERARMARDLYSLLHLPMVGGIVLFAFGLKTTLGDPRGSLASEPAFGLAGGIALYLLAHVAFRLRIGGGLGRGRPVAAIVLIGLVPLATKVPALAALSLVALVSVALIAYEALAHRESRALIRSRRGEFAMGELYQIERARGRKFR
jgi:low temperature requirement protein LtrA